MSSILIDPGDLLAAARRYGAAGDALENAQLGLPLATPEMPPDLAARAHGTVQRARVDLGQQRDFALRQAADLRRRARLAALADAGGISPLFGPLAGAMSVFGRGPSLARRFTMPRPPKAEQDELNGVQQLGSDMFSLGAAPIDAVTFGLFGKGIDAVGGDRIYNRRRAAAKAGDAASWIFPTGGLRKLGKEALETQASRQAKGLEHRGFRPPPGTRVRPPGIPQHWRVRPSKGSEGGGVRYMNPRNKGDSVRVMPGNPNSKHPESRLPYVRWQRNGQPLDADGNVLKTKKGPEAHVPLKDFKFDPKVFE